MGDDIPELCCAAGACCDEPKRIAELAELIEKWCGKHLTATEVAVAIHQHFTLLPKALGFSEAFAAYAKMVREHPYE